MSTSKKSWAYNKKYFSKKVGDPSNRNLEKLKVVQVGNIARRKWKMVSQDPVVVYDKRKIIKKMIVQIIYWLYYV